MAMATKKAFSKKNTSGMPPSSVIVSPTATAASATNDGSAYQTTNANTVHGAQAADCRALIMLSKETNRPPKANSSAPKAAANVVSAQRRRSQYMPAAAHT